METVQQISIPLARVFNLPLDDGEVLFEWKEANIMPLFKKGLRNKSDKYIPVSLTSVICKLLESLIKDQKKLWWTSSLGIYYKILLNMDS